MRWVVLIFVGLAVLMGACGQASTDESASEPGTATDAFRGEIEDELAAALLRDLSLLEEDEARCISAAVLAAMPESVTGPEDIDFFAQRLVDGTRAAQESCLTPDRIAELDTRTREPAEETFILVVRAITQDLSTDDQELVGAGHLVCGLAQEAGSLDALLARLAATPRASEEVARNLSPFLGRVLPVEELFTFSTNAVVTLCPENDR